MWPNSDLSIIQAEGFSSRDLCQTPLVHELFKPAEFHSRFSSGAKQPSSKGRSNLHISILSVDYIVGSCLFKKTSVFNDVLLVVVKC